MLSNMHTIGTTTIVLAAALAICAGSAEAKMGDATKDRKSIDKKYTWDLTHLYKSMDVWEKELAAVEKLVGDFGVCKGTLGEGSGKLADCLGQLFEIKRRFGKLSAYASRVYHVDLKVAESQAQHGRIGKIGTRLEAELSFVEPEILDIPKEKLDEWSKDGKLADYDRFLSNVTRRREHIRSKEVEAVLAQTGDMAQGSTKIYQTLATLNVPWPRIRLSDGSEKLIDQSGYGALRYLQNQWDRLRVFQAFWSTMTAYRETFAGLLATRVNTDHFYAQVKGYKGDLESALDATEVPTKIYHNMIKEIRRHLPVLHRYLALRKKVLGVEELGYHDLYTSIVPSVEMTYNYDDSFKLILEAHKVMGKQYVKDLSRAFEDRWADVYPTPGKRTGAYMSGEAFDVHPYVLLNHTDDYNSMSTAAHEFGHAMHSFYSSRNQPYAKADYPIFVAEVASTVNENILFLHMVEKEKDPEKKRFLLGQALESFRTTVFRQALFAEFELRIHEKAAAGETLTADVLSELYLTLLREYYGEKEGFIKIDPLYAIEWAYIPHFFYNFYMFQYTTSFIAATSIARAISEGDKKARDNYLEMLKAGGSKTPVGLLNMAGVDMSGAGPYEGAFKMMDGILDQIEKLMK